MNVETLASLFETSSLLTIVGSIFLINLALTLGEIILDLFTHKERRWKDTAANCAIFAVAQVLEGTAYASIGFVGLLPFYWLAPWEIPMFWWTWLIAIFAADFTYYWMHRIEHERRILWASHSVHHSSQDFNLTVSFRLSWIESLFEWMFLIPMILLGFNPFQAIIGLVLVAQYQHWIHTERVHKLGWLDKVFNTPSVHRVHHGSNAQYIDKNYGGILIIWDRLFGTYAPEEETVIYGITTPIGSHNPLIINFKEYAALLRDVKLAKNWKTAFGYMFHAPGWCPEMPSVEQDEVGQ